MKRQIKACLVLWSLFMTTGLFAQQAGKIENGFNTENYPEVSFVYHSFDPSLLDKSNFWYLKEAGVNKDFKVEVLPADVDTLPQTTLILWEDMACNGKEQYNFTKNVLTGFFTDIKIPASDKIAVAAFNRRKNASSSLINITDGFVNDKTQILSDINKYKPSKEFYPQFPNRSDMYTAIREGMELLAPIKGSKAIIVFTAGYPMKNSGSDSEVQVLLKAQQKHIPVYIFQYYNHSGVATESEGFAKSTFGDYKSYKDAPTAGSALKNLYPQIRNRYQGHNYKISFTSDSERGARANMITFCVVGFELQEQLLPPPTPPTPPYTMGMWIKEHLLVVITVSILFILLIIGIVISIRRAKKKAEYTHQELVDLTAKHEREMIDAKKAHNEREKKAKERRLAEAKKAEEDRLSHLMSVKNIYPRLKYCEGSNIQTYEVTKPVTHIGRTPECDLVLNNSTVSKEHADLIFNGVGFEIIDKGSTNKVIVNGNFVERVALKSGDIIGLGQVVITFYM